MLQPCIYLIPNACLAQSLVTWLSGTSIRKVYSGMGFSAFCIVLNCHCQIDRFETTSVEKIRWLAQTAGQRTCPTLKQLFRRSAVIRIAFGSLQENNQVEACLICLLSCTRISVEIVWSGSLHPKHTK